VRWIVVDPRRTDTAAMADLHLPIQPGTDVALFNGMLHHLVWEGLLDTAFIERHTSGFAALKHLLRDYSPRMAADICGIPVEHLVTAAEWFGRSPAALSLYCMGLNQSAHGTDKNLALMQLHLATRQIGRPDAARRPAVAALPTLAPGALAPRPGRPAVDLAEAVRAGRVKALWIACANPAHSMPDIGPVRAALQRAEYVIVQEAFAGTDAVPC